MSHIPDRLDKNTFTKYENTLCKVAYTKEYFYC